MFHPQVNPIYDSSHYCHRDCTTSQMCWNTARISSLTSHRLFRLWKLHRLGCNKCAMSEKMQFINIHGASLCICTSSLGDGSNFPDISCQPRNSFILCQQQCALRPLCASKGGIWSWQVPSKPDWCCASLRMGRSAGVWHFRATRRQACHTDNVPWGEVASKTVSLFI